MDKETAKQKFNEADSFYRARDFEAALKVLKELDEAFPDSRHIMFPMARCYAKLQYLQVAVDLCDEIYEKFGYDKALELREQVGRITPPGLNFDDIGIDVEGLHDSEQKLESDL